jgi:hypothetical protein
MDEVRCPVSPSHRITISASITDYFASVIEDALRSRKVEASRAASQYLVGVLTDYAHPDEEAESTFSRPLTFQLRDALEASGPTRFRRLRSLGDGVLYVAGFFGGHIDLRGIDRGYVVRVGVTAYDNASAMLRSSGHRAEHDVLAELAQKFEQFVAVLNEIADGALAQGARGEGGLLHLYERWLKTGSSRIAQELGARGIIPTRGKEGLN